MITKENARVTPSQVYEQLKKVMDPELHIDIVSLGLIYNVVATSGHIKVTMTLTTPGCPLAPIIDKMIHDALEPLGSKKITLKLVWEPAWAKDMMSEEAKLQLNMT